MLPFKQAHANHKFRVIVDNALTHSAKHYSVEYFGMKPGTRCKPDKIFYRAEEEMVANDYGVAVSFSPKFHYELNPTEELWAHQKQFVRHRIDQTFPTMVKLINKSRINFIQKNVSLKLMRRFWRTLAAYERGDSYDYVLKMYFSSMYKANVISHRQIINSNSNN
ncbi:unnamed protein product [Adineta ricciae]|uniref:Uncharacterized protein n=1 Tax=Adineta ricciae TaxID=249248 RepID=A0A815VNR1_ADIRI|nr:unnamed protein product [Adineta ricciae]CAF1532726.1 unnamed protein product [Adineta ricciae]